MWPAILAGLLPFIPAKSSSVSMRPRNREAVSGIRTVADEWGHVFNRRVDPRASVSAWKGLFCLPDVPGASNAAGKCYYINRLVRKNIV